MKSSTQIAGLPIISIADGTELGKVKLLVINAERGSIDFLTIENEEWEVSIKAIPFEKIVGIGEFAVTVESDNAVINISDIPIANQLFNKKVRIKNTKTVTRKGQLIGEAIEYYADEETGLILGLTVNTGDQELYLSSQNVLTYGKDIIIVKDEASDNFQENFNELDPNALKPSIAEEEKSAPSNSEVTSPNAAEAEVAVAVEDDVLGSLKRKQILLLNGKKLIKTIYDSKGEVLLEAGKALTPDDITKAQEDGPSTVVELSMNVEA